MVETQLPAVAKTVYLQCKKCEAERYHVVLAHTSATAAKVKCEICGSQKTYKLAAPKKAAKPLKPGQKPRATRANKAEEHRLEYARLVESAGDSTKYNMRANFSNHQKLEHPKFGVGVIRASFPDKIEVVFADEVRSLIHNRE